MLLRILIVYSHVSSTTTTSNVLEGDSLQKSSNSNGPRASNYQRLQVCFLDSIIGSRTTLHNDTILRNLSLRKTL